MMYNIRLMRLIIENWSAPSMISSAHIQRICEARRRFGQDFPYVELDTKMLDAFPYFQRLIGDTIVSDPVIYIVKLRPADNNSVKEFIQWSKTNQFEIDHGIPRSISN